MDHLKVWGFTVKDVTQPNFAAGTSDGGEGKRILIPFFTLRLGFVRRIIDFVTSLGWTSENKVELVCLTKAERTLADFHDGYGNESSAFCEKWSRRYLDGYVIELCGPSDAKCLMEQWKEQPKNTIFAMAMPRYYGGRSYNGPDLSYIDVLSSDWGGHRSVDGSFLWIAEFEFVVYRLRKI